MTVAVSRLIRRLHREGYTPVAISVELNARGITRAGGGRWRARHVQADLHGMTAKAWKRQVTTKGMTY